MAILTSQETYQRNHDEHQPTKKKRVKPYPKENEKQSSSSWNHIKSLMTCKQVDLVHDPKSAKFHLSKLGSSCRSFKDIVHGNARVVHREDFSPESSSLGQDTGLLTRRTGYGTSSGRSLAGKSSGMQLGKLSGCYECRMIVDPGRYPVARDMMSSCLLCGEVFPKPESLELHQRIRHAVSELASDDSSRNIVEIIFKSSWLKKDCPMFSIERILKVHNTPRTIQKFEDCRNAVKERALHAARKNPRCAADGNELLRFHCTNLSCALGASASTSLCGAVPACGVCTIIRNGFQSVRESGRGVMTSASSGRAHDALAGSGGGRSRAMLVCRVIAGRVNRLSDESMGSPPGDLTCDSVSGHGGAYSNMEELYSYNPKGILPCFVVVYRILNMV